MLAEYSKSWERSLNPDTLIGAGLGGIVGLKRPMALELLHIDFRSMENGERPGKEIHDGQYLSEIATEEELEQSGWGPGGSLGLGGRN